MKKLTVLLFIATLTSCGVQWKYSTLNHLGHISSVYTVNDYQVDTLTEFQFRNKLRTDIGFRLDFARYALSQPVSFDWNNRLLGRQYDSRWNSYYWNRDQMWNDWAWGYTGWNSWGSPHRWSPFGYDRWGYSMYNGWNNYGWGYNNWIGNGYYGWNNYYGQGWRRGNNSYTYGRRGYNRVISTTRRTVNSKRTTNYNKQQRLSNDDQIIRNNTRTTRSTQSSNNGRWRGSREIIPTKPVRVRQPSTVQPGQIRGGSRTSVPQQTRTSVNASSKRRSSGGR